MVDMAEGTEVKSVVSAAQEEPVEAPLTPAQKNANVVALRGNIAADAELKRKRQALELQRERILSERTSSPHRRSALANALADIEEKLAELGWTIHL